MDKIAKTIIFTVATGALIKQNSQEGLSTANKILKKLDLTMEEYNRNQGIIQQKVKLDPNFSIKSIRNLNSIDKKFAQQCLVIALLEGGNSSDTVTVQKFKQFMDLFDMYDNSL